MKVTSVNGHIRHQILYIEDSVRIEGCFFVIRYWGMKLDGPEWLDVFFNEEGREVFQVEYPKSKPKTLWQKILEAISARATT